MAHTTEATEPAPQRNSVARDVRILIVDWANVSKESANKTMKVVVCLARSPGMESRSRKIKNNSSSYHLPTRSLPWGAPENYIPTPCWSLVVGWLMPPMFIEKRGQASSIAALQYQQYCIPRRPERADGCNSLDSAERGLRRTNPALVRRLTSGPIMTVVHPPLPAPLRSFPLYHVRLLKVRPRQAKELSEEQLGR